MSTSAKSRIHSSQAEARGSESVGAPEDIKETPQVAFLVDQYDEDWTRLWYALVRGEGQLVAASAEHRRAIQWLKAKYPQYDTDMLADDAHVLRITPVHITAWGKI